MHWTYLYIYESYQNADCNSVGRGWYPEKAMAPHSSTLAWKIPWMEEPGRLQSMGSLRVGHDFTFTFTFHFQALEKEMATHSSVLAWRIPGMGEPGGLLSMGSHRVRHDWSDLAVAVAGWCPRKGISNKLPGDTDAARVASLRTLKLEEILEVLLLSFLVLKREETSNLVALNHGSLHCRVNHCCDVCCAKLLQC